MPLDHDVAGSIAQQMRDSKQLRTWRKMTTILSGYDLYRLTDGARARLARDFAAAGLELTPSMAEVTRDARVQISMIGAQASSGARPGSIEALAELVSIWARSDVGWEKVPSFPIGEGAVIVDIDLSLGGDHQGLVDALPAYLPGLNREVVEDLLKPDRHASFKMPKPGEQTSRASLYVAKVEDGEAERPEKAVLLSMGLVEFAVGAHWLLLARHSPDTYLSGSPADVGQRPLAVDKYLQSLSEYGLDAAATSQDAALAVIHQGVDSFSRARDVLGSYLETWRTDFAKGSRDKSLLNDLQATLPLVVYALEPLRRPSVVRWTEGRMRGQAKELTDQVARNYEALQDLQGTVAAAVGQADQAKNEDYQRSLATLAAVFLAPALVASIFGANELLEDSPSDLVWLIVAMVVAGVATTVLIRRKFQMRTPPRVTSHAGVAVGTAGATSGRTTVRAVPAEARTLPEPRIADRVDH